MADSLSPQKLPEFFKPKPQERALEILRNPLAIAALASVGIHGVLFVVLPMLPAAKPREMDPQQTVSVIELSPTEQLRLPDFANPQITFPPIASQSRSQPPSRSNPKKSSPPSLFNNSSIYDFPLLSPPPPITVLPNFEIPPILEPPPRPRQTSPAQTPAKTPPKATAKPTPEPTETTEPAREEGTPDRPATIPPEAIERLRALQRQLQEQKVAQQPSEQEPGTATTQSDAYSQVIAWLDRMAASEKVDPTVFREALTKSKEQTLSVSCPVEKCADKIAKLPTQPSFLIAVNPDGKMIDPPVQVKTGDAALDEAAISALKEFVATLKGTEKHEVYRLRVQFEEQPES